MARAAPLLFCTEAGSEFRRLAARPGQRATRRLRRRCRSCQRLGDVVSTVPRNAGRFSDSHALTPDAAFSSSESTWEKVMTWFGVLVCDRRGGAHDTRKRIRLGSCMVFRWASSNRPKMDELKRNAESTRLRCEARRQSPFICLRIKGNYAAIASFTDN